MSACSSDGGHRLRSYREGSRAAAPLAVAAMGFGMSFGVLARAAGMGAVAPVVMSATTFAGSAQFAATSIVEAGGGMGAAVVAAALLNARYIPIGLSVAVSFDWGPMWRLLGAQLVIDESWALGNMGGGRFDLGRIVGAGVVMYVGWVGGSVAGVLGGDLVGDPDRLGLDAAFPALFLALLVPQVRGRRAATTAAALGGALALALVPLTRPGVPIVAASAACLLGLLPDARPDARPEASPGAST